MFIPLAPSLLSIRSAYVASICVLCKLTLAFQVWHMMSYCAQRSNAQVLELLLLLIWNVRVCGETDSS